MGIQCTRSLSQFNHYGALAYHTLASLQAGGDNGADAIGSTEGYKAFLELLRGYLTNTKWVPISSTIPVLGRVRTCSSLAVRM